MKEIYELDVYKLAENLSDKTRGSFEETKAWLRKLVRRKVVGASEVAEYQLIIEQLGPKLNAFIRSTR
ncbi:MAG: hypothetical protein AB1512_31865 [Thermodesulfobacteriota bacterium]